MLARFFGRIQNQVTNCSDAFRVCVFILVLSRGILFCDFYLLPYSSLKTIGASEHKKKIHVAHH